MTYCPQYVAHKTNIEHVWDLFWLLCVNTQICSVKCKVTHCGESLKNKPASYSVINPYESLLWTWKQSLLILTP